MKVLYKTLLMVLFLQNSSAFSTYFSDTPLMQAIAKKQHPRVIKRMIVEGANVNAIDMEFLRCLKPVLCYALDRGIDQESVEIIKMLIEAGADVNEITYNRVEDAQLYGMMPLLTYAAIYSSAEIVQLLVDAGAHDTIIAESNISFKKTAIMIAQELGKSDVVKVLEKN